jgi:K+-sensing histidine kinase KdpD
VADRRTIGAMAMALIGAAVGMSLAWLLEITGHPSWSVLLMVLCATGPSIWIALYDQGERRPRFVKWARWEGPPWAKVVVTLLLIAVTLLVVHALNVNPRDSAYLPLLPPVILSGIVLGFGPALLAVVVSTIIADYIYALPEYSFAITHWEDAAGLAVFAILGGVIALIIHEIISLRE